MEVLPHPVPVILSSHERSEGFTEAFRRPRLIRGSVAFVLQALHGNVEPRMALLFVEKLNYKPIGWLISVRVRVRVYSAWEQAGLDMVSPTIAWMLPFNGLKDLGLSWVCSKG